MLEKLLTKLRGKDHRAAYRAIPALCRLNDASLAAIVGSYKPKDEQRRFQLELARIALGGGIQALAREWLRLGTDEQRRNLLSEISQYWKEWDGEGSVELAIAALEEPEDKTRGYALLCVMAALHFSNVSAEQRARVTRALVRTMARHEERPLGLFWLVKYVELLGMTASASDGDALTQLERLRPFSGASRRTVFEKLDPDNLPWPDNILAEKKGVRLVASVWDLGTGLLEIKVLETALRQIRARG